MANQITITVRADTVQAAAQLAEFSKQVSAGLQQSVAASATTSAQSLQTLSRTSQFAKTGLMQLQSTIFLLAGSRFPGLVQGAIAIRSGLGLARASALLFGVSLTAVGAAAAIVAAALLPVYFGLKAYKAKMEEAATVTRLLAQTQALVAKNQEFVAQALKKGVISQTDADRIGDLLSFGSVSTLRTAQEEMRKLGIAPAQIEATVKLDKLLREMRLAALEGQNAEWAKAKQLYEERMREIADLSDASAGAAKRRADAEAAAKAELDAAQQAIMAEARKQEEVNLLKGLEIEITDHQIANAGRVVGMAEEEFGIRNRIYTELQKRGIITAERYNQLWDEANRKRLQGLIEEKAALKGIAEEERRLADLRSQTARETLQNSIRASETDPYLTQQERLQTMLPLLQQYMDMLAGQVELQKARAADTSLDEGDRVTAEQDIVYLQQQQLDLLRQQQELQDAQSFKGTAQRGLADLSSSFGNIGSNAAVAGLDAIKSGVQGVGDAIMGAIDGTRTWGQVFAQVGKQIIANLINVVIQWIANMTIIWALKKLFGTKDNQQAAQSAAAWAPAAIAASIASYGSAAAIGVAAYGLALASGTAMTAAISGAGSGGGREHGGPVEAGRPYIVGERGPELMVPRESGYIMSNAGLQASFATESAAAQGKARHETRIALHVWDDKWAMKRHIEEDPEFQHLVLDIVRRSLSPVS